MVTIIFEAHGTTYDNEAHRASGHFDVELSPLGKQQAKELGERYRTKLPDAVFCSDLRRSYETAEIAFGSSAPVIRDKRLRECDYGTMTRLPSDAVEAERRNCVKTPFPNGESYEQTTARGEGFLKDLAAKYAGKTVMIVGHRATQYGLEHLINNVPLKDAVAAPWQWQPGWAYELQWKK